MAFGQTRFVVVPLKLYVLLFAQTFGLFSHVNSCQLAYLTVRFKLPPSPCLTHSLSLCLSLTSMEHRRTSRAMWKLCAERENFAVVLAVYRFEPTIFIVNFPKTSKPLLHGAISWACVSFFSLLVTCLKLAMSKSVYYLWVYVFWASFVSCSTPSIHLFSIVHSNVRLVDRLFVAELLLFFFIIL